MEKEFADLLVGAILIAICVIPFVILNAKIRKRKKLLLSQIVSLANSKHCQIDNYEVFANHIIGLDKSKGHVFYYQNHDKTNHGQEIDLSTIGHCQVKVNSHQFENGSNKKKVIDSVDLILTPKSKTTNIQLEFFNKDITTQLVGELQSAEKWSRLMNDKIKDL